MNPNAPKILIISSDTGGGHRSAAAAIVAGIQSFVAGESYAIRVVRAVEESAAIAERLVRLYNWLLRNKQHWMKYFYWAINRFRPETREFFHARCIGYVRDLSHGDQIDVGVGGQFTIDFWPGELDRYYGGGPGYGFEIFFRIRPSRHDHGAKHSTE